MGPFDTLAKIAKYSLLVIMLTVCEYLWVGSFSLFKEDYRGIFYAVATIVGIIGLYFSINVFVWTIHFLAGLMDYSLDVNFSSFIRVVFLCVGAMLMTAVDVLIGAYLGKGIKELWKYLLPKVPSVFTGFLSWIEKYPVFVSVILCVVTIISSILIAQYLPTKTKDRLTNETDGLQDP